MEEKINNIIHQAANYYKSNCKFYGDTLIIRDKQLKRISNILSTLPEGKINCIETGASQNIDDGCFGVFFAKISELTNGEFHSVELSKDILEKSKELYNKLELKVKHHHSDSVEFLTKTKIIPNLVHLDSYDINIKNPFPAALYGWREFIAIEDKMPLGSILIVDDNWFKGTWVEYNYTSPPELAGTVEKITIDYPIIGKGANIYHFVKEGESNWEKISEDVIGENVKLIFKKIKNEK